MSTLAYRRAPGCIFRFVENILNANGDRWVRDKPIDRHVDVHKGKSVVNQTQIN